MDKARHDEFWNIYAASVQPAVERACQAVSRARTDNGMPVEDMQAWIDEKVWSMLLCDQEPFFDGFTTGDRSPQESAARLERGAGLLARWAYLALSRSFWRRKNRERRYAEALGAPTSTAAKPLPQAVQASSASSTAGAGSIRTGPAPAGRAAALAMVNREEAPMEANERIAEDLAKLRDRLDTKTKARLAATWPERGERKRVAMALGVTDEETDRLIDDVSEGRVRANTVDQWRSRSRTRAIDAARGGARGGAVIRPLLMVIALVAALLLSASVARAEQTGGRGGRAEVNAIIQIDTPSSHTHATIVAASDIGLRSEQTGGRGGRK